MTFPTTRRLRSWRTAAVMTAAAAAAAVSLTGSGASASGPTATVSSVAYALPQAANASAPGCTDHTISGSGGASIKIDSCLHGDNPVLTASATLKLSAPASTRWTSCQVSVSLRDDTAKNTITKQTYNCSPLSGYGAAPARTFGYLINGGDGLNYHTYVAVTATYRTTTTAGSMATPAATPVNSPEYRFPNTQLYRWDIPLTDSQTLSRGSVTWNVRSTVANVFAELHRCFNCNFPVPGAPAKYPAYGQLLNLWDVFGAVHAPVRAYPHDADGYLLYVAQPGHFDGAGSTVEFRFYTTSTGRVHMIVTAYTADHSVLQWLSKAGATARWHQFAAQIGTDLVHHHEGTAVSGD